MNKLVKNCASALVLVLASVSAFAQTISTDKADYEPAETVILSGSGFAASEQVTVTADGDTNGSHLTATLTAGADGSLAGSLVLPAVYEHQYALLALGATGDQAKTTFLDAPGSMDRVDPNPGEYTMACSASRSFTARVRTNTNVSVSGLAVTWTAEAGSVSPATGVSDVGGRVSTNYTAPAAAGMYKLEVAGNSGSPKVSWNVKVECAATPVLVAPTLTCPADINLDTEPGLCGAVANFSATVTGTPAPVVTYSQMPGTLFSRGLTPVTVTASNDAGTASCSFNVTVKDVSAPQITAPANAAYECAGSVPAASPLDATATDNCGAVVTVSETDNGGIGNAASPKVITRTYTATDPEGNTASAQQTITVIDAVIPAFSPIAAGSFECSKDVPAGSALDATATDNCGAPTVTYVGETTNGGIGNSASPLVITRTYKAVDAVGNEAFATKEITVIDAVSPVFDPLTPGAFQCSQDVPGGLASDATAKDNCGAPTVTYQGETSNGGAGSPSSPLVLTRTYKAVDGVGNETVVSNQITVIDNIAPVITVADVTGNACVALPQATATDNCGGPVSLTNNAPQWFPLGGSQVTWTGTDNHGNTATALQNVAITGYGAVSAYAAPVGASARPGQVKKGSSLPVKFTLLECPRYPLATATISVDPAKATSTSYPKLSNAFRYSASGQQYIYNLDINSTYSLNNVYNIMSTLGDGQVITGAITIGK